MISSIFTANQGFKQNNYNIKSLTSIVFDKCEKLEYHFDEFCRFHDLSPLMVQYALVGGIVGGIIGDRKSVV